MHSFSRRSLFAAAGGALATARVAKATASSIGSARQRREQALLKRIEAALAQSNQPLPDQVSNGDETTFAAKLGNFSKGLPHNDLGEVDLNAYAALVNALNNGEFGDMEKLIMGASNPSNQMKLVNPMAGIAFDMEGADSHALVQPPAPNLTSAEAAGEMVELYWMALLRDVAFTDYANNSMVQAACDDLTRLSDFRGPKIDGKVTPQTLFRGFTPGDIVGPYLSQFMVRPVPFGPQAIEQKIRAYAPGIDYLTDYAAWLAVQSGNAPSAGQTYDGRTLLRNPRDMSAWVHIDVLYQAYFNAANIMMAAPDASDLVTGGGIGAAASPNNPYASSKTEIGFGTFGGPFFATMVAESSTRALKSVWFQKWFVHRRLRPEAFGGRLHNRLAGKAGYFLHSDVTSSDAAARVKQKYGTWLLPIAFVEGCPLHPSYGAGHATVAGASVTMLKALFDESFPITNPVVPSADGQTLIPYTGSDANKLTLGGELNKLAANVAIGRNMAGVHYRSDYTASLRLGEQVAISILRDQRETFRESFNGFTLTTFDGETITI